MKNIVPLRSFIFDRLYHPKGGYFCRPDFQVGELSHPINFKSLIGFDDYQKELSDKYPKNAWLTPSQIFKPYYGMGIGQYMKEAEQKYREKKWQKDKKLKIVEAGGGTGSAAQSILFYFQNFGQEYFENIEYDIVEISPQLCKHIKKKLNKSFPQLMQRGQIKIINQSIMDYSFNERCYAIFLEVLDNMPHDKVVLNSTTGKHDLMSFIDINTNKETYLPVQQDQLVSSTLSLYERAMITKPQRKQSKNILDRIAEKIVDKFYRTSTGNNEVFLPTHQLQLMRHISKRIPQAHLIMGDFDRLISKVKGVNAPIVSFKGEKSEQKKDYDTYLVQRGSADIFFPVDFHLLKLMHQECLKRQSTVVKSFQFYQQFSLQQWGTSKSGFNPIKEDFGNTSFLITQI